MRSEWVTAAATAEAFRGITPDELAVMLDCIGRDVRSYRAGELVATEGEPMGALGVVLEGTVTVQKLRPTGDLVTMGSFGPGQTIGEVVLFSDRPRWPATVTAATPAALMFLPRDRIVGVCAQRCGMHQTLLFNLLGTLSNRALLLNRKVDYLATKSLRARVAMFILEQRKGDGLLVQLPGNRNAIAEFLNVPRPSLSRELAQLKAEGLIDYHLDQVRIRDLTRLQAEAES